MQLACAPTVVRRSLKYAIVVGALLILINHGDAILRGDLPPARLLRMLLTIAVPYTVSTLSSVEAMRQLRGDHPAPPAGDFIPLPVLERQRVAHLPAGRICRRAR